jgi:hypothetical protein
MALERYQEVEAERAGGGDYKSRKRVVDAYKADSWISTRLKIFVSLASRVMLSENSQRIEQIPIIPVLLRSRYREVLEVFLDVSLSHPVAKWSPHRKVI